MNPGPQERDAESVVIAFCQAVAARDAAQIRHFFADDVVYHNIPIEPAVGIEATLEAMAGFFGMFETIAFELTHIAALGNVVLTERVDRMTLGPTVVPIPVMGAFEVVDGKIVAWRDYFDMNQVAQMMAGDPPA